jgi:hypothetical protein
VSRLALAAADGISAQAREAGKPGDSAPAILLGQETDNQTPALLIQGGDQVVQGAMLFRGGAIGLVATA